MVASKEAKEAKEAIESSVNFVPDKNFRIKGGTQRVELGCIGDGMHLVHDIFSYRRRVAGLEGQPVTPEWTEQPALALEERGGNGDIQGRYILAYAEDVKALGDDLAAKVVEHIQALQSRRAVVEGHQVAI